MSERFSIAQVTPYPWEERHEVNLFVRCLSEELAGRGHRVIVLAPSDSRALVRESRELLRQARSRPDVLFSRGDAPQVIAVGQSLPFPPTRRMAAVSLPIDVSRKIEQVLDALPLDFVHVHEPFAPSAASAALRHSRALNVGTFHLPTERVLSTQFARRLVELLFGRLDARTASYEVTRNLVERFFPADYRLIRPGAVTADGTQGPPRNGEAPLRILFAAEEERAALRLFLRALRNLDPELPWEAAIWSAHPWEGPVRLSHTLAERVELRSAADESFAQAVGRADVVCACSVGTDPAPQVLSAALAAGTIPVASRLPIYAELLRDGEDGLLFDAGDADFLVAQLSRLVSVPELRRDLTKQTKPGRPELSWQRVADDFEPIYAEIAARRHATDSKPDVRRRLGGRELIACDLHMHTDHSHDCATSVDLLLETAKRRGLGAVAITDHNEISGALEAAERADGIKVIVAEEVKTAKEGEVIGLFIREKIPRGMSLAATIAEIRRQGGLVYVPHPFDRLHSVPDYEHLLEVVADIDIIEVFNPRVTFSAFNEEAERFATKYRVVAGAGSDAHVVQGLGSVKIRMRDFEGPEEFLESLRDADIVRRPKSLLYVQALKFLQTKGRPAPAKRAARAKAHHRARHKKAATGSSRRKR